MLPARPVFLVVQRASNHAKHSGYHRLAEWLGPRGVVQVWGHPFPRRGTWRLALPLAKRAGLNWYDTEAVLTEVWAAGLASWHAGILHFLQGESSYRYAGMLTIRRRVRQIATLHVPPSFLAEYVHQLHHLERLDAIVFLAHNQFELLDRLRRRPSAYLVPHGIDTDFYVPGTRPAASPTCLFVGNFLRDFGMLDRVIGGVRQHAPEVRFRLVTLPEVAARWQGRAGVDACSGLDDEALRQAYQEAALLVMPLRDCTANNAVLEAMACGLPIVATDVGGVRDYVNSKCALLTPAGDPEAMVEAVLQLMGDSAEREIMARAARTQACLFSWPLVAKQMLSVYAALM